MYIKSALFQLENWDAQARLGSARNLPGSAKLGKFQLELITTEYVCIKVLGVDSIFKSIKQIRWVFLITQKKLRDGRLIEIIFVLFWR